MFIFILATESMGQMKWWTYSNVNFIFQALAVSGAVRFLTFACNKFITETVKSVSRINKLSHDVASWDASWSASRSNFTQCISIDKQ